MDDNLLRRLLAEGESSRLDYKSQQYPFAGASDGQKGELLKDILAMANASREVDAFILIGIEEQPGGRAQVIGIVDHLDDADLQQFVNSKTNRPMLFSYFEFQADGKTLAAIRVPLQRRPFFIKKRFGPVDARVVYMRRGSSTVEADPDEVHDMGVSSAVPASRR
jgi:Schlafen, AlbA_2